MFVLQAWGGSLQPAQQAHAESSRSCLISSCAASSHTGTHTSQIVHDCPAGQSTAIFERLSAQNLHGRRDLGLQLQLELPHLQHCQQHTCTLSLIQVLCRCRGH